MLQVCSREIRIPEAGTAKADTQQIGAAEVNSGEIDARRQEPRSAGLRIKLPGPSGFRTVKCTRKVRLRDSSAEGQSSKVRLRQAGSGEHCASYRSGDKDGARKVRLAENGTAEVRSPEERPAEVGPGQISLLELRISQVRAFEMNAFQPCPTQIGNAQQLPTILSCRKLADEFLGGQ